VNGANKPTVALRSVATYPIVALRMDGATIAALRTAGRICDVQTTEHYYPRDERC
jgi:hypothetical protein